MLRVFQRAPIHQKLMLIAMLTTGGALLLAGAALIVFNVVRFKDEMRHDLATLAEVVAQNSTAPLTFQDQTAAVETLRALGARPTITAAALYDRKGRLFAHWSPPGAAVAFPPRPGPDDSQFERNALVAFSKVDLKGERIGTVYLRSSLDELYGRVRMQALTVGLVFLSSGLA